MSSELVENTEERKKRLRIKKIKNRLRNKVSKIENMNDEEEKNNYKNLDDGATNERREAKTSK